MLTTQTLPSAPIPHKKDRLNSYKRVCDSPGVGSQRGSMSHLRHHPLSQTSRQGTKVLVEAVKGADVFDPAQHIETLWAARKHHVNTKEETYQSVLDNILMQFTSKRKEPLKELFPAKHQHCYQSFQSLPATLTCLQLNLEMGWRFAICMTQQTYLQSVMAVEPH